MSCHSNSKINSKKLGIDGKVITIALAGNANVGKSVLFNRLTGSSQIIGNWPGKTVEKAEGTLKYKGQDIKVIDLPGIYSFSTFGMEELISREYIAKEKPDVVINVVDASVLERNLFFTLQLIEMNIPLVVCLNQVDEAKKKGIDIDFNKLQKKLGVPVVPTVAIRGQGIYDLIGITLQIALTNDLVKSNLRYGSEIEKRIDNLEDVIQLKQLGLIYPSRWVAIKLLENDPEIKKAVAAKSLDIIKLSDILAGEISAIHDEAPFAIMASERYSLAHKISRETQHQSVVRSTTSDKIEWLTTHELFGYFTSIGVILGLLLWTFSIGDFLSGLFSDALSILSPVDPILGGTLIEVALNGAFGGLVAGITLIIPYVVPFYIMLALIEDSGILTRVAFMMDTAMHKIGLHGKALIPLILGFGCNVPAIRACRIMETKHEQLLAAFVITLAPCAARTILILGLVSAFVNIWWALAIYVIDIVLIFVLGRIAFKVVPGETTGLIMEMHSFKVPSLSVVVRQTWVRTKSLIYLVFPIYIIGSAVLQLLFAVGVLESVGIVLSPLTVGWLGLPVIVGSLLIMGVIRKEFIILGATAIFGTTNLLMFLTPVQLITLALIGILYLPCLSTIAILAKDFNWKTAIVISLANLGTAIIVGGIAYRLLSFFV